MKMSKKKKIYCQKSGIVCIIYVKVTLLLSRPFHAWLPVLIHIG